MHFSPLPNFQNRPYGPLEICTGSRHAWELNHKSKWEESSLIVRESIEIGTESYDFVRRTIVKQLVVCSMLTRDADLYFMHFSCIVDSFISICTVSREKCLASSLECILARNNYVWICHHNFVSVVPLRNNQIRELLLFYRPGEQLTSKGRVSLN